MTNANIKQQQKETNNIARRGAELSQHMNAFALHVLCVEFDFFEPKQRKKSEAALGTAAKKLAAKYKDVKNKRLRAFLLDEFEKGLAKPESFAAQYFSRVFNATSPDESKWWQFVNIDELNKVIHEWLKRQRGSKGRVNVRRALSDQLRRLRYAHTACEHWYEEASLITMHCTILFWLLDAAELSPEIDGRLRDALLLVQSEQQNQMGNVWLDSDVKSHIGTPDYNHALAEIDVCQDKVLMVKRASRSEKVDESFETEAPSPSLKARSRWRTAREVADAIRNDRDLGGDLKWVWDKRRNFYPKRKAKKGQTHLFDPEELLSGALSEGDIVTSDLPRIRKDLGLKSPSKTFPTSGKI